jgi:uncharacterized protein (TIGR00661 family)
VNTRKNILICPLEWGLGHAGRMVPLAKRLSELNQNIIFGSGEEHLCFFRKEVPGATYIHFPGFRINYSHFLPQYLIILLNTPVLLYHIILEHKKLKKVIREYSIDIVISDSRIGLWNSEIKTVFVTHQLRIMFPPPFRLLEFTGRILIRSIVRKYKFCFVPDLEGELNVSGKLSHGILLPENVRYIGILSRLERTSLPNNPHSGKSLVILSGPEPQRSVIKQKLINIFLNNGMPVVVLEGKPAETDESYSIKNITCFNHLSHDKTINLINESETIITRAGYTTIMELISLGRSALLIPTYGQTEQEYLADHLSQNGWFRSVTQKVLNDKTNLTMSSQLIPSGIMGESKRLLDAALEELLEQ